MKTETETILLIFPFFLLPSHLRRGKVEVMGESGAINEMSVAHTSAIK